MKLVIRNILFILLIAGKGYAQPGRHALGVRGTLDGVGISYKSYTGSRYAIETQLNFGGIRYLEGKSISAAALIEYHLPLPSPEFRIFFGGGLHFGRWTDRQDAGHPNEIIIGLDGVGGIEYLFRKFPLSISGDLRPSLNYIQEVEFFPHGMLGVGLRYYFGSNRVKQVRFPGPGGRSQHSS